MTLRLDLTVPEGPFVVEHPIVLSLCLTNDGDPVAFPLDYECGGVITAHVYDHAGQWLGRYDGDTQDLRLGLEPEARPDAARPTEAMPSGATLRWSVDLRSYVALDVPARHAVEVVVAFAPSGVRVCSQRCAFEVVANHVHAFDALLDVVATPVLHTVQVHEGEQGARLAAHLRSVHAPEAAWRGATLPVRSGAQPRLAEADFATRASFAHDFARWIAWLEEDVVRLRRLGEPSGPDDDGWGPACEKPQPDGTRWLGRPIEHADGGVSIWLHTSAAKGGVLVRSRWDAAGVPLRDDVRVPVHVRDPSPAVVSSDGAGSTWIACAEAGALPVTLVRAGPEGTATSIPLLDATQVAGEAHAGERLVVLGLRLELKLHRDPSPGVLAAVLRHHDEQPTLWIGHASLEQVGAASAWSARKLAPAPGALEPGETLVAADLVALSPTSIEVLVVTSNGRILRERDGELHGVDDPRSPAARDAKLVVLDGRARMVLPTAARGLHVQ